jgi:long-chain fatty acid transport protein
VGGRRLFAALVSAALASAGGDALASPEDVFGFGPRSVAMGATGAADAEGFGAVWANPALLSLARERAITLGLFGASFDLHAPRRLSYDPLRGSVIGAVLPVPFGGALERRVALGLGFFTPFDLVVRGRILAPETPQFLLADRTQSVAVQAGVGVDVGWGVRVGGGFAALAALDGSVVVATDTSGRVGTQVEDTLVASYAPVLGASVDLGSSWRVGLTFRGQLVGRFDVVIRVRDLGPIVVPPLDISGIAQFDPWQLALEVARVRGPWRGAIGATYKRWSAYPGPAEPTVRCPPAGTPNFDGDCTPLVPPAAGYHDVVVPRAGVERVIEAAEGVTMKLRAGAFFEPSPAPPQTRESNWLDSHRTALTLGYGLSLARPLPAIDLDVFAQLHVLHPRTHEKDADVAATNPGARGLVSSGTILAGGMTAGVRF